MAIDQFWGTGPIYRQAKKITAIAVHALSFPRFMSHFPWRYDIIVAGGYRTYDPRNPGHPFNDGQFHAWIDTWVDHLHSKQEVVLNLRGFRHNTGSNNTWANGTPINANLIRWSHLAWCWWTHEQTHFDLIGTTIWTWDSHPSAEGGITGLHDLFLENTQDANGNGLNDLRDQDARYFALARGGSGGCGI